MKPPWLLGIACLMTATAVARQHDEDVGRLFLDAAQHRQPVAVRQAKVEQDKVNARDFLERFGDGASLEDLVPVLGQTLTQGPPDERLVIDDQECCSGHGASV